MTTALHERIVELISPRSTVLDLGCGDGRLLQKLMQTKQCTGYGVEIDNDNVEQCVKRKVPVIQMNLNDGLSIIEDDAFDWVLQINTLQHLRNTETMLRETARVATAPSLPSPILGIGRTVGRYCAGACPLPKRCPTNGMTRPIFA